MRYVILMLVTLGMIFCLPACTAPSQPLARQAMTMGLNADQQHITDLGRLAKQANLERAIAAATTRPAAEVLTELHNADEAVSWIQFQQHERKKALFRMALMYIDEQEGALNIIWRRLQEIFGAPAQESTTQQQLNAVLSELTSSS